MIENELKSGIIFCLLGKMKNYLFISIQINVTEGERERGGWREEEEDGDEEMKKKKRKKQTE